MHLLCVFERSHLPVLLSRMTCSAVTAEWMLSLAKDILGMPTKTRCQQLSDVNVICLVSLLARVSQHSRTNLMTSENLSICFWPTLMRPDFTTMDALTATRTYQTVIESFICQCAFFFYNQPLADALPGSPSSTPSGGGTSAYSCMSGGLSSSPALSPAPYVRPSTPPVIPHYGPPLHHHHHHLHHHHHHQHQSPSHSPPAAPQSPIPTLLPASLHHHHPPTEQHTLWTRDQEKQRGWWGQAGRWCHLNWFMGWKDQTEEEFKSEAVRSEVEIGKDAVCTGSHVWEKTGHLWGTAKIWAYISDQLWRTHNFRLCSRASLHLLPHSETYTETLTEEKCITSSC